MLKTLKIILTFLSRPLINNVAVIIGTVYVVYSYYNPPAPTTSAAGLNPINLMSWLAENLLYIALIAVIFINTLVLLIIRIRNGKINKSQGIISKLSELQGSYILKPHYVTASKHGQNSKESSLSKGGTADILTNSLKYDMFYSNEIANNIINGAKYIYILPHTNSTFYDLHSFIVKIHSSIHHALILSATANIIDKLEELCKINLEFWIFNKNNSCLYNFAIFRQLSDGAEQPFDQYWWYINPSDMGEDSYMLTYEITENHDKTALEEILLSLKGSTAKKSGYDVYFHREVLTDLFGDQK